MFDIEQAIAAWRRQIAAGGIKSTEVVDELETHLRDDIEQQVRSGADAQKAFNSAVLRLGEAGVLQREFAKSAGRAEKNPRRRFTAGLCLASAVFVLLINTWTLIEFDLSALERSIGLCMVVFVALYMVGLPLLGRSLSRAAYARVLGVNKILILLTPLVPIWALLTASHIVSFEVGIIPTMVIWLLLAAAAITAFACGFRDDYGRDKGSGGPVPPTSLGPQTIPPGQPCPPDSGVSILLPDDFAPIARQSLEVAREEASRLGHDFIGTEHVLLGVLKQAQGATAAILQRSNADRGAIEREIGRLVVAHASHAVAATLPLTPRARKALQLAASEAETHNQPSLSVEYILLGLLLEGGGVAALALKNVGVRVERLREEVFRACTQT